VQAGLAQGAIRAAQAGYPVYSVSSDVQGSTGMSTFQKSFPDRFVEVGIAESNMVSVAAGLAKVGYIPIVDTFAQFGVTKGNLPLTMAALLRGWLGVSIQEVNRDLAESFGLERPAGALVAAVVPDSPAAKGGLQAGDIILKVDGTAIEFSADLPHLIGRKRPGSTAALEVVRNGKPLDLKVKVGELPSEPEKLAQQGGGGAQPQNRLGILVSDLTAEQLRELELPHGIVIEEVVDGVGAAIGLRPGMVITAIANKPVKSAAEFNLIVKSLPANRLIAMRVLRDGVPLFVTFKLPK